MKMRKGVRSKAEGVTQTQKAQQAAQASNSTMEPNTSERSGGQRYWQGAGKVWKSRYKRRSETLQTDTWAPVQSGLKAEKKAEKHKKANMRNKRLES